MMKNKHKDNKRPFFVVQLLELLLSEDIDDYVCVPRSWITHRLTDQKALIAYPEDADAFLTRNRAKKRETPHDSWKVYLGIIKYSSDIQPEHVLDRKLRSANQHLWSSPKKDKPQLAVKPYENHRKPLMKLLIKRKVQSEFQKKNGKKRLKLNKALKNIHAIRNYTKMASECSKKNQSIINPDDQLVKVTSTGKTSVASNNRNTEKSIQPKAAAENKSSTELVLLNSNRSTSSKQPLIVHQGHSEQLSMPIIDIIDPTQVVNINEGVQPESATEKWTPCGKISSNTPKQNCEPEPVFEKAIPMVPNSRLNNRHQDPRLRNISAGPSTEDTSNSQETHEHNIMKNASKTVLNPLKRDNHFSSLCQPTQPPYSTSSRNLCSDSQPVEIDVRRSTEVINDGQRPRFHDITSDTPSVSAHLPISMQLSTVLYKNSRNKPTLSVNENSSNKETCFRKEARNRPTAVKHLSVSNISSSMVSPSSVIRQASQTTQNHVQEVSIGSVMYPESNTARNCIDPRSFLQGITKHSQGIQQVQEKELRRSSEINHIHQRVYNSDIASSKSAIQNLSNIAYQSDWFIEQPNERQYLPNHENFSQRYAQVQNLHTRPNDAQIVDRRSCIQDSIMNRAYVTQNQLNPVFQPSQFLPQHGNRYLPSNHIYLQQEQRRLEQFRKYSMGTYNNYKPTPQNIRINEPHATRLPINTSVGTNSKRRKTSLQGVTKKTLLDPEIQVRLNERSTEQNNMEQGAFPYRIIVEPILTTQDMEVQTTASPEPSHRTQFTSVEENHVYRNSLKQKIMADKYSETDFIMDHVHFKDTTGRSLAVESSPMLVDSACQVDEYSMEEPTLSYQEAASDHEVVTDDKIVSEQDLPLDDEIFTEEAPTETVNTVDCTEENITPGNNTEARPTVLTNLTALDQQMHARIVAEQQMLNEFVTLFVQMSTTMSTASDMFNKLQSSMSQSAETYQRLVESVQTFNTSGNFLMIPRSSDNATSGVSHGPEKKQTGEERGGNSSKADNYNNNGIEQAMKKNHEHRHTFVLPPEYDPNNSRWTLKYQKQMPGLIELLPKSEIYVRYSQLEHCKRVSKDCRTLARELLTEVFSTSALSVCSLTGQKAKAFTNVDIQDRPGLDEYARMVLLVFVERYGLQQGWDTSETQVIMNGIRSKIQEMRAKYGRSTGC